MGMSGETAGVRSLLGPLPLPDSQNDLRPLRPLRPALPTDGDVSPCPWRYPYSPPYIYIYIITLNLRGKGWEQWAHTVFIG